jgi:hypothetical protein
MLVDAAEAPHPRAALRSGGPKHDALGELRCLLGGEQAVSSEAQPGRGLAYEAPSGPGHPDTFGVEQPAGAGGTSALRDLHHRRNGRAQR